MKTLIKQHGFNLIELMVVIAIIGVISSIAIPSYRDYMIDVKWGKAIASVRALKLAIDACLSENNGVPNHCDSLAADELALYGISVFSPENDDLYRVALVPDLAAIKIEGKTPLADCILSLTPTFNNASNMITWKYVMTSGSALAATERCIKFVKNAQAN